MSTSARLLSTIAIAVLTTSALVIQGRRKATTFMDGRPQHGRTFSTISMDGELRCRRAGDLRARTDLSANLFAGRSASSGLRSRQSRVIAC